MRRVSRRLYDMGRFFVMYATSSATMQVFDWLGWIPFELRQADIFLGSLGIAIALNSCYMHNPRPKFTSKPDLADDDERRLPYARGRDI